MENREVTIKINDLYWTVKTVSADAPELNPKDKEELGAWGLCDMETLTIYLQNERLNPQLYKRYIWHEITHAFCLSYGIRPEVWANDSDAEEKLCYFMQSFGQSIYETVNYVYNCLYVEN